MEVIIKLDSSNIESTDEGFSLVISEDDKVLMNLYKQYPEAFNNIEFDYDGKHFYIELNL